MLQTANRQLMKRADIPPKKTQHKSNIPTVAEADELAVRYFEAKTSDEEENILRHFLCSPAGNNRKYDELRAVMGFIATGRNLEQKQVSPIKNRTKNRPSKRRMWSAAAALTAIFATGATSWLAFTSAHPEYLANACVAYVDGRKITETNAVMQQMYGSLENVNHPEKELTIENQLGAMFETLEQE